MKGDDSHNVGKGKRTHKPKPVDPKMLDEDDDEEDDSDFGTDQEGSGSDDDEESGEDE